MEIHLTSAYGYSFAAEWLQSNATRSHVICTDDPAEADVILFAEGHPDQDPYFRHVLKSDLYKKYKHKCVLYHDRDKTITALPTLSPSIEAWQFNPKHKKAAPYIARLCDNDAVQQAVADFREERRFLYSFYGNRSYPVRNQIFSLQHPSDTFIKDMYGVHWWQATQQERVQFGVEFVEVLQDSYFALSPRGIGPATYRLFEAMQLGRAPVIIADAWVKDPAVDWASFSIQIPESKMQQLPCILRERKDEAVAMGKQARKNWEEHFSPEVCLQKLAQGAAELLQNRYTVLDSMSDHLQFLQSPWHLKNLVRIEVKRMLGKIKKSNNEPKGAVLGCS